MNAAINGGMPARTRLNEKLYIPIPVHTAENHSRRMETAEENTAATLAISQTGSRVVMAMSKQEFEAEKKYLLAITIAKDLREKGLLTEKEYREIDTKLRSEYGAKFSTLLSP